MLRDPVTHDWHSLSAAPGLIEDRSLQWIYSFDSEVTVAWGLYGGQATSASLGRRGLRWWVMVSMSVYVSCRPELSNERLIPVVSPVT